MLVLDRDRDRMLWELVQDFLLDLMLDFMWEQEQEQVCVQVMEGCSA